MKYIIVKDAWDFETPILFGENLNHNDIAGKMNVVSAGFVDVPWFDSIGECAQSPQCYGESQTLKLKPRQEDEEIIKAIFDKVRGD